MKEKEISIDTEEIAEYFYNELVKIGRVPDEEILQELADITFDFLIHKTIIEEEAEE